MEWNITRQRQTMQGVVSGVSVRLSPSSTTVSAARFSTEDDPVLCRIFARISAPGFVQAAPVCNKVGFSLRGVSPQEVFPDV